MGCHPNIDYDKFPKQGSRLNTEVRVGFHYRGVQLKAKCIRDDFEAPFLTLFQLEDGRVVRAEECQYALGPEPPIPTPMSTSPTDEVGC